MSEHTRTLLSYLHRLAAPAAPDAVLLTRWLEQRDEAAFAALMARHGPMVLGVCHRVLGDVQDAEDAFQATFLVLATKAANLRRPEALAGFLYGIAQRLARKARAAAKRRPMRQTRSDAPEPTDPQPNPLDVLSGRELLALVDAEIARLPETYRLPLLLCVLQGRTVEEAARQLGWSIGSVRGRLERGREQLRQRLTRRGLGLSVGALALLAPVAVPKELLAASLHQIAAPSVAVASLLAGWTSALKLKTVCLALVILSAVGLGAGLSFLPAPVAETPAASAPKNPSIEEKKEARVDRYGDPLPEGAVARLGTLRFRAPGEIVALAFAPDGKTLAVSTHGGLFLMDAENGKRIRHLPTVRGESMWDTTDTEHFLFFSPDGKFLISRGVKKGGFFKPVVRVWELNGQGKPREFDIGPWVIWVGWSDEGKPLAIRVAEKDGALHLHELATGRSHLFACKDPLKDPAGDVNTSPVVACAPMPKALALVDNENVIHVWDTATGRERCALRSKGERIYHLTFSPDGSRLVAHKEKVIQMWDAIKGNVVFTVDGMNEYGDPPVFTPDGKTLALVDSSKAIRLLEAATGKERSRTNEKVGFSPRFVFSADSKWLATADGFHGTAVLLWDLATGKKKAGPVGHNYRPRGIAFTPDGRRVATGGEVDGTIQFWDRTNGEPLMHIRRPGKFVRDIGLSLDGRSLFSSWPDTDENVWISDAATGELQHVIKLEDSDLPDTRQSVTSMHFSDDRTRLVVFSRYYSKKNVELGQQGILITGWDASTRKQLFQRRRPGFDSHLVLSTDASMLAEPQSESRSILDGTPRYSMRLEDLATGEQLLTFPTLQGQTWPRAFSADGRLLASNTYTYKPGKDGKPGKQIYTIRLWETLTTAEVLSLPAVDYNGVAFSRDNRLMAVTAPEHEIVVWDLRLGRESRRFKGYDSEMIFWLSFSPDGRQLVSSLTDSTLLIWDMGTPAPPPKLSAEDTAKAWADLAGKDTPRAFRARGALASTPDEAMPLLTKHLHPATSTDPQRLRRLLTDLDSEQFVVREKAQEELESLGDLAEPMLRKALENKPTLEVRKRVQAVLERLRGPVTGPELLQALRAVAVLEDIGTPEARRLLGELAKGAPDARLTREAKASLERLQRRTVGK